MWGPSCFYEGVHQYGQFRGGFLADAQLQQPLEYERFLLEREQRSFRAHHQCTTLTGECNSERCAHFGSRNKRFRALDEHFDNGFRCDSRERSVWPGLQGRLELVGVAGRSRRGVTLWQL